MIELEIKNALLTTRLCQFIKINELKILLRYCHTISFSANDVILHQGKLGSGLFIILEGTALVTAKILGEGVIKLATLGHGNFIGEIGVIHNGPSPTSVIAMQSVNCLFIKNDFFNSLSLFFPEIKYGIISAIIYEIFDNLINTKNKIEKIMAESHMLTLSLFDIAIKSLSKQASIQFSDVGIDKVTLHKFGLFSLFDDNEYSELMEHANLIEADNNCVLIHANEKDFACYIILQGAVQSSIIHNNKYAKLYVLAPISLFCSTSIIDSNLPSIVNYTTCEKTILLKFRSSDLETIQKNNITLWYKFFDLIAKSFVSLELAADKLNIRLNSEIYNR